MGLISYLDMKKRQLRWLDGVMVRASDL